MSLKHDLIHLAMLGINNRNTKKSTNRNTKKSYKAITDRNTKKSYRASIADFCEWAKNNGISKFRHMKGRRADVLDAYAKYLQAKAYSSGTVHTKLAPICKALQINMNQINKPKRKASDITKRRVNTANLQGKRELAKRRYERAVRLAEVSGARRAELKRLTYRDLTAVDESGYRCVAIKGGKGGKDTLQRLTPSQKALCDRFVQEAILSGISLDDRVLTEEETKNHINFHSIRADRAKAAYDMYRTRIEKEGKEPLIKELITRWNNFYTDDPIVIQENGVLVIGSKSRAKKYIKTIAEADTPYLLRGDNRKRALNEGRPVQYNRLALLATSVFELSHWRVDVTMTNYML